MGKSEGGMLMASATAEEMNNWANEMWELVKTFDGLTDEQKQKLTEKVKFVSDKFVPTWMFNMTLK